MLADRKILVTGPAGQIAERLTRFLAADNDVWGVARFTEPGSRERVESYGVTTLVADLAEGALDGMPDDFTHVLHLAAFQGPGDDTDHALRVNAEATGLVLSHCRAAQAALVMSTTSVYRPHPDPWHPFVETDPLGGAYTPHSPTYPASKLGQEAVARTCARMLGVPVVIARMNASCGPDGGLPASHADAVLARRPVVARWDPQPYSAIHQDDINTQVAAVLSAASVPATVVNWGGDEVVTLQEWCAWFGELCGTQPGMNVTDVPGSHRGQVADPARRLALTGPCRVRWREGMRAVLEARRARAQDGN